MGAIGVLLWRRFRSGTYLRFSTLFGQARVYQVEDDAGSPVRLLEVGGIVQSGTYVDERYTELVFEYLKRYDLMFEAERPIRHVAVLGCGGYDYPEHLIAHHPDVLVDAVEIDPAITEIARRYFFLDRLIEEYCVSATENCPPPSSDAPEDVRQPVPEAEKETSPPSIGQEKNLPNDSQLNSADCETLDRLNLICADALEHLRATTVLYDGIVNDCFDAGTPPAHLTGRTFAEAVHERLTPGGLYLTNIVSPLEGPRAAFLHGQIAQLSDVFKHVYAIPCDPDSLTEPDNVIVAATDVPLPTKVSSLFG